MNENEKSQKLELWYEQPAAEWEESLPAGNGRLGAMVWGIPECEKIGLNEDCLWSGWERDKNNQGAADYLPQVRKLLFERKYVEAEKVATEHCLGEYSESYLPLGNLLVDFGGAFGTGAGGTGISDYRRSLDLNKSLASVKYSLNGVNFYRRVFASFPDDAIYFCFEADKAFDCRIGFESQLVHNVTADGTRLMVRGQCPEHVDPSYLGDTPEPVVQGTRGRFFRAAFAVAACDGTVSACAGDSSDSVDSSDSAAGFAVLGATKLVIKFRAFSAAKDAELDKADLFADLVPESGAAQAEKLIESAFARHTADYKSIFDTVTLDLGPQLDAATDRRLEVLKNGAADPGLYALYFAYGRYLLISSSRAGSQPANLQGIWNWHLRAPWSCNFTTNINAQMNYWPALSCGLESCLEPYFDFVKDLSEKGKSAAQVHYGCRGFVVHHNVDFWRNTNPMGIIYGQTKGDPGVAVWSLWAMGGPWLCQELYRYYEYSGDKVFLKETLYPVLRECALFLADFVVEHDGLFGTCPSTSPENNFWAPETAEPVKASVARNCAMDLAMIREVFGHFKAVSAELAADTSNEKAVAATGKAVAAPSAGAAAQTLPACDAASACDADKVSGTGKPCDAASALAAGDAELLSRIDHILANLTPFQTGSKGQLLEWNEEFAECEPGHRHISHLYGLFPGEVFAGDEALIQACRRSLEIRLENGGGYTGWSCAWIINMFAILGDGENAGKFLEVLLKRSTYPNLWDAHPPFQIDGNFGGTAGIANMLVQDRGGKVTLLPALPPMFADGSVRGLRIKGRQAVDIDWKDGKITSSRIYGI